MSKFSSPFMAKSPLRNGDKKLGGKKGDTYGDEVEIGIEAPADNYFTRGSETQRGNIQKSFFDSGNNSVEDVDYKDKTVNDPNKILDKPLTEQEDAYGVNVRREKDGSVTVDKGLNKVSEIKPSGINSSPFNQNGERQEFVRDTIRLNPKKLVEGKTVNDGLLDDVYADKVAKKAKWWGKGKTKKGIGYYSNQDMSEVMHDKKGPYVVNLKENESFRPGNTHDLIDN